MAGPGKRGRKLSRPNQQAQQHALVDEDEVPNNTNVSESMANMNATGSGSDSTSRVVLEHEIVGSTIGSGSSSSSHATRGQTRNLSLGKKKDSGVSLVIELNEDSGRIVGKDSGLYITESGCVVRKLGRFDVAKWADLDEDLKKDLINIVKEGFEFPDSIGMQKAMEKQMQSQLKSGRHNFHKIFKKFASKEEALKHLPKGLTPETWQSMCERYSTPEFQKMSARNTRNRAAQKFPNTCGTKSLARVVHDKRVKEGKELSEIEKFEIGHFSKKKVTW